MDDWTLSGGWFSSSMDLTRWKRSCRASVRSWWASSPRDCTSTSCLFPKVTSTSRPFGSRKARSSAHEGRRKPGGESGVECSTDGRTRGREVGHGECSLAGSTGGETRKGEG